MIKLLPVVTTEEHLKKIVLQEEQADELFPCKVEDGMFSIVGNDNNVYGIFKVVQYWQDRFRIEAFISKNCRPVMLQMIRVLKHLYKINAPIRLEAEVLNSFEQGKRFLKLFGFEQESIMKQYYNGKDYCLFVKLKNG